MYNACVFAPINVTIPIEMSQNIDLGPYAKIIAHRRAKATIICSVGYDTHIIVTQYDADERIVLVSDPIQHQWSELLRPTATSLKVSIEFFNPVNYDHSWCQYIELHIEPDYKAPDTHLRYPW